MGTLGNPQPTPAAGIEDMLQLFSRTGDGVWAVDAEQRIVLWNEAARAVLGYTAGETVGQNCYQLLGGRDADGRPVCRDACSVWTRTHRGDVVPAFNVRVRRRDGRACWLSVSVIAVPQEPGPPERLALVHLFRVLGQGADWPPPLRLRLLGSVAVERADGSPVDGPLWRRARVRALLALLALQRGQPVRRETLVETLWPERPYAAALRNLNTTVYNLRRSLEPALRGGKRSLYVHYEGECYLLNGGRIHWLDVDAFEQAIAQAHQQHDPERGRALFQEALALYRGDFVADLDADLVSGWLERERLRILYLNTLEAVGVLCARQGRLVEAGEYYLKAMTVDPCREGAARQLMRLALRRGDRAGALAHYRRLERTLQRELGIPPDEATRLLYEQIRGEGQ